MTFSDLFSTGRRADVCAAPLISCTTRFCFDSPDVAHDPDLDLPALCVVIQKDLTLPGYIGEARIDEPMEVPDASVPSLDESGFLLGSSWILLESSSSRLGIPFRRCPLIGLLSHPGSWRSSAKSMGKFVSLGNSKFQASTHLLFAHTSSLSLRSCGLFWPLGGRARTS